MARRSVSFLNVEGRGNSARIPVLRWQADAPGPSVVITANVHGDECTGVAVVHTLDRFLEGALRSGAVTLYPSLNPGGLAQRSRPVPPTGVDLNRMFPGKTTGAFPDRLAGAVWHDLASRQPSFVIDLHADSCAAIPYVIVDRPVAHSGRSRAAMDVALDDLARSTGLTAVREYPDDEYVRFALDRSLAGAVVNLLKVPAITIEAGPRRYIDPDAVLATFEAVRGVMAQHGLVDGATTQHASRVDGGPWRRAPAPRAGFDGVFIADLRPGARFARDERLGEVRSPAGEVLEEIVAPDAGVVLSWTETSWVGVGGVVGTLAVADGDD